MCDETSEASVFVFTFDEYELITVCISLYQLNDTDETMHQI